MHKSLVRRSTKRSHRLCRRLGCGMLLSMLAVVLVWSSPAPALTQSPVGAQAQPTIAAGYAESSAIKADGSLWLWGSDSEEVSAEDGSALLVPTRLGAENDWAAVTASMFAWYALKADGSLWTMGFGSETPSGASSSTDVAMPVRIGTGNDWTAVSAGMLDSLAIKKDGSLWCLDTLLVLNDGLDGDSTEQSDVSARIGMDTRLGGGVRRPVAQGILFAGIEEGRLALGCGGRQRVRLGRCAGYRSLSATYNVTRIGTDNDWATASAGGGGALALKKDGSLWWVSPEYMYDEADDPDSDNAGAFVYEVGRMGTDSDWAVASTSGPHVLAIKTDGSLWALGYNDSGQLGDGTTNFP